MTKMASIDPNLDQNLAWLKEKFDGSADFFTKKMQLCGVECAVMLCDDLAGVDLAWELLLRPLQYEPRRFSDGAELAKYLAVHSGRGFFDIGKGREMPDQLCRRFACELRWFTDLLDVFRGV